ncbi:MAG: long-chain fatty acid--CoA ligase [Microbacteriaceae bacterium]
MPKQHSTPLLVEIEGYRNVTELLTRRAEQAPLHIAFERPAQSSDLSAPWKQISTQEFLNEVSLLAKGLIAVGVKAGDAIAIMSETRYEWAVADLAAWFAGAVVVPIYDTSSPIQVAAIFRDADVRVAVAGNVQQGDILRQAIRETGVDTLGVWTMDSENAGANNPTLSELSARAIEVSDDVLEQRRSAADTHSPATIVYTSGTTGDPKGAVLTHGNFITQTLNIAAAYGDVVHSGGNTIIFLPLAHVLARGLQLICIASGMRIAHLSDPTKAVSTLGVIKPSFLVVVPRVLQKIHEAAAKKAAKMHLSRLWQAARSNAIEWGRWAEEIDAKNAQTPPRGLRLRHAFFDRLFFRKLRAVLGSRVDYILSGGATLDAELSLFFRGIGVPVIEGYGLTETTAPLTGNLPGHIRSGTVGAPLPGHTVRISEEGEVLARGPGVFAGYRNPDHNIDAFIDGYFRTGDLGSLDADGRLTLNGRLKDVIITANGKTVVPTIWENALAAHPLVSHAIMVGEGWSYLSAILLLDPEALIASASNARVEERIFDSESFTEVTDTHLRAELQKAIDTANALVSRSEQVRSFALVSANLDDSTLVTPTMKIKRRMVLERGALIIDNLYH